MTGGRRGVRVAGLLALLSLLVPACASASGGAGSPLGSGRAVSVVASTNVYGDIVRQVAGDLAGDKVSITSIITGSDADPHSYEADVRNQLALSRADIVVKNGGGYDDFVDTMLRAATNRGLRVLSVVQLSGRSAPSDGQLNEHVWYDLPTVSKLAGRLVTELSAVDPADASAFAANAATFQRRLEQLEATEAAVRSAHAGAGVAITEPVPLYLLEACGLTNETPGEFSEAIEEGSDVPATVLQRTLDLLRDEQVRLLAYNEQTAGPETERVLAAARAHDVAVVPFTETLPNDEDYLAWMSDNLAAIQAALR